MTWPGVAMFTGAVPGRYIRFPYQPWERAFAVLDERLCGGDIDAADLAHRLATILEDLGAVVAAEALHRYAGVLLTALPYEVSVDHRRVEWACCLAANLLSQQRRAESEQVLVAAVALAEALLGPDDADTWAAKARLNDVWMEARR